MEWYIEHYLDEEVTTDNYTQCIKQVIQDVFEYPEWQRVAQELGHQTLDPVPSLCGTEAEKVTRAIKLPEVPASGGSGESDAHKELKKWLAKHPEIFSQYGAYPEGKNEYLLRSGDRLDVFFEGVTQVLAVEAKTSEASDAELARGIFQCVKYRATLRAMQKVSGKLPTAQALLATQRELTGEILEAANRLNVSWIVVR